MGSCTHALGLRLAANADPVGCSVGQSRIGGSQGGHHRIETDEQGVAMKTTNVDGIELAYDVQGVGETVLFIHGAIWADFLRPLADEPAFSGFQRIRYHRRGYGKSRAPAGGFDVQAADILALLDHIEVDRAHMVGHSEGAMIEFSGT